MVISNIIREVAASEYLNFDSELHTKMVNEETNAELWISARVFFVRMEPPPHPSLLMSQDAKVTKSEPLQYKGWSGTEFEAFKANFERTIESHWDGKFFLIPDGAWGVFGVSSGGLVIPNIKCRVNVHIESDRSKAHLVINAYHVEAFRQSFITNRRTGALDSLDLSPRETEGGQWQTPAVHEFGHYIGLDHVDFSHCLKAGKNTNDGICYGTDPYRRGDLMGVGMRLDKWHAYPWVTRIKRHLLNAYQGVNWTVSLSEPAPVTGYTLTDNRVHVNIKDIETLIFQNVNLLASSFKSKKDE